MPCDCEQLLFRYVKPKEPWRFLLYDAEKSIIFLEYKKEYLHPVISGIVCVFPLPSLSRWTFCLGQIS